MADKQIDFPPLQKEVRWLAPFMSGSRSSASSSSWSSCSRTSTGLSSGRGDKYRSVDVTALSPLRDLQQTTGRRTDLRSRRGAGSSCRRELTSSIPPSERLDAARVPDLHQRRPGLAEPRSLASLGLGAAIAGSALARRPGSAKPDRRRLEQPDRLAVLVDVDRERGRVLAEAGHRHHVAAEGDDPARARVRPKVAHRHREARSARS